MERYMARRARHRRHPQRDRHARQLRVVGQHGRLADARPRRHRHRPRPAGHRPGRGPRPPVDRRTSPSGGTAHDEWYNYVAQRPRHRARARDDGRDHLHPAATPWATTTRSRGASRTTAAAPGSPAWATSARTTRAAAHAAHRRRREVVGRRWRGDCGGTVWDKFERVPLDQNTSAPFAMDVAPDGRVFFTELVRGQIRMYDPGPRTTSTAITIPVYSGGEDGLLGIALRPELRPTATSTSTTRPASANDSDPANFFSVVSRFTVGRAARTIDRATEKVILEVPARRLPDEPGHTGGGLEFEPDGNLYLGVGDDVNPHSEPSGGYAPLSERDGTFHDARATSANTNDLRGKLLRITPERRRRGYTIPEGNMFPEAEDDAAKDPARDLRDGLPQPVPLLGRPGDRLGRAWRTTRPTTAPTNPDARPRRHRRVEPDHEPGYYGWPLCMGNNEPFRDVDYRTNPVTVGAYFDCANPINDSIRNTGLTKLPPATRRRHVVRLQALLGAVGDPAGRWPGPDGRPVLPLRPEPAVGHQVPGVLRRQAVLLRVVAQQDVLDQPEGPAPARAAGSRRSTRSCRSSSSSRRSTPSSVLTARCTSSTGVADSAATTRTRGCTGSTTSPARARRRRRSSATPDSGQAPLTVALRRLRPHRPGERPATYEWDFTGDGTVDSTELKPTLHLHRRTASTPPGSR